MDGKAPAECERQERDGALPITRAGALEPVPHGGDLDSARRRHPRAAEPWIDLSTGINPLSYPVPPLDAGAWERLPTVSDQRALLAAAATRYGLSDVGRIVAAPGTQALIQLLPRLVPPTRVAVLGPTYDEHEACWDRHGHEVRICDGLEAALAEGARVVVAVNPNNPTGRLLARGDLVATAEHLALDGGLLVVDEAFIDVMPPAAGLTADAPPNCVVLRSFGKTYGLAGVRLGFAIAAPKLAAGLRAELGPWAVSGPAITIGRAALADEAWLAHTSARLARDAERLDDLLRAANATVLGGTPLFRLVAHTDAARLADRLGNAGIHVRAFASQPHWLRFGLPGPAHAWDRLGSALSSLA